MARSYGAAWLPATGRHATQQLSPWRGETAPQLVAVFFVDCTVAGWAVVLVTVPWRMEAGTKQPLKTNMATYQ
jgi:hypothetical protein